MTFITTTRVSVCLLVQSKGTTQYHHEDGLKTNLYKVEEI